MQEIDWKALIPPEQWEVYRRVLSVIAGEGLPFALGGGLAVSAYTGRLRNTKDLDIYIRPGDRDRVVGAMTECGLTDYFETNPYDRKWIYRGNRGDVIVDAIWAMANQRTQVDDEWLNRGPMITMYDMDLRVMPVEELIWCKLYVLQRERCDWPDILNLIYASGPTIDWDHLLDRLETDLPLLRGVLSIFSWISPDRARSIPHWVWETLSLPTSTRSADPEGRPARPDLLDTRPWYSGQQQFPSAA